MKKFQLSSFNPDGLRQIFDIFSRKFQNFSDFYLPHMEYERSIGFVSRKMKIIIADFHVLGLFMAEKHDLSEKKNSVCHAPSPPLLDEI
jgi:hypothetical protein